ncbi:MAG: tetratricopeptide repeat protein [Pyrinomonadaceae bacterium]
MRSAHRLLPLILLLVILGHAPSVFANFEQIRDLIRRGDFASALQVCDQDLKLQPRDFRILTLKGIALQGVGRTAESLDAFRRALAIEPQFLPALQAAAQLEYQMRDPRCQQTLEAILHLRPEPTVHAMLGVLAFERKDCAAAIAHYEKAGGVADDPIVKWQRGSCFYQLEQWDAAEVQFRALLSLKEDDQVRYNLGLVQSSGGKYADAIATLQTLARKDRPDADAMSLLASAYEANKQTPEALEILRRAIDLYPREERLYLDLAALCLEHSAFLIGTEILEAGAQNIPQSARIQTMLGVMHASSGVMIKAEEAFKRAEQLGPDASYGRVGLAIILMHNGAADQMIRLLREQAKRGPDVPVVNITLAQALLQTSNSPDELREAQSLLLRVIERRPVDAAAHSLLGKIYLRLGDTSAAALTLETTIRLNPSDRGAAYQLMILYQRAGRTREAADLKAKVEKLIDTESAEEVEAGRYRLVRVPEGRPGQ